MKYPIDLKRYLQCTGKLLEHRIGQIFQELEFETQISKGQSNGVDLIVKDKEGKLVLVAEILNWCPYSELSPKRKKKIIFNLTQHECRKLLIYATLENESYLRDLSDLGISSLKIGFQVLPRFFYEHWALNKQVEQRRIDSRETKELIKSKILEYLLSLE